MNRPMVLVAHVLHPAVVEGFLPAAMELGYDVILVTDHGFAHRNYFVERPESLPQEIIECDVFSPLAIIDALQGRGIRPALVFSNSDHLQAATALVAEYFQLPAKSWQCCYSAKNKAAMRERLQWLGLPTTPSVLLLPGQEIPRSLNYPVVAKPREGVASMDVRLCHSEAELAGYARDFHRANPVTPILVEEYIRGELFTLETLGDGKEIRAIGGFDVRLSEPPHFVELQAQWNGANALKYRDAALEQVRAFGATFGVCHSEFIATAQGPVLVEINYRSIGDGREFLLDRLLPGGWFKPILELHRGNMLGTPEAGGYNALIRYLTPDREGRLVRQSSPVARRETDMHWEFRPLKKTGDAVRRPRSNKDYLGILTAIAEQGVPLEQRVTGICQSLDWRVDA